MITKRVLRGGSWIIDAQSVRCANRLDIGPVNRSATFGFRLVAKAISPNRERVLRGGSWFSDAQCVRCAYCIATIPSLRDAILGLRPVAKATS